MQLPPCNHTTHLSFTRALPLLLAVVSFLVIKRTNVVMLKLLAISRNALVVCAGVALFADQISTTQLCGYALSLTFFAAYNYILVTQPAGR